ncbi:hypothetical protein [Methylocystis echinoides]|uniref:Uncharacterized protein n=1 Tax=Methylocystis echinoides TaxID=29468 RepID=A0A9W6GV44_9HYPH|nr:hypothetical protein [Methylocystis echinoides]GLI93460.1 hypothetical protein LMG27198_24520 [Methylocystis echinoides]
MSARNRLLICFLAAAAALPAADAWALRRTHQIYPRFAPHLGPWVEEGWRREDWSRAPAVREWSWSAPADFDPLTGYPSSTAEYPWGYTTPFVRVGRKCVASELNLSPGGEVVRYQRVRSSAYCY